MIVSLGPAQECAANEQYPQLVAVWQNIVAEALTATIHRVDDGGVTSEPAHPALVAFAIVREIAADPDATRERLLWLLASAAAHQALEAGRG